MVDVGRGAYNMPRVRLAFHHTYYELLQEAAFKAAGKSEKLLAVLKKRNMGSTVLVGDEITKAIHAQSKAFKAALSSN